ncbi:hypothetical protein FRC10_008565 [Ceratobasidium sp. 414]|nr:hypothetical protein FRC10_008565 [Ceratobasidium sp. 414]
MSVVMFTPQTAIKLPQMSCALLATVDGEDSLMTNATGVHFEIMNEDIQIGCALLRMVAAGVDIQHMLSLAQLSPFDVIEPDNDANNNTSPCPYIVISYAPDTEESIFAFQHNARPIQHTQDGSALMVPGFSAIRKQPESDNEPTMTVMPDEATGADDFEITFWWAPADDSMDTYSSSHDSDATLETLGSSHDLDHIHVGTSYTGGTAGLLDAVAESRLCSTVDPWHRQSFLTPYPSGVSVEDWSDEYEWTNQDEDEVFGMDDEQEGCCASDAMETCEGE